MTMSVVPEVDDQPPLKSLVRDKCGPDSLSGELTKGSGHGDVPMHRYIADVQPYEWLAVALECQAEPSQQVSAATKDPKKTGSTITLSIGSGLTALEDGDDSAAVTKAEEMLRLNAYVAQAPVNASVDVC